MSTVFIGGSRHLGRLNDAVRSRLNNIVDREHRVVIGDANGGDRAVQSHLASKGYRNVTVYCMDGGCRNNVGQWPVRVIEANGKRGFAYFSMKDAAMARDADCGLMIWDGKSRGTFANMERLVDSGKPVVVYLSSDHDFKTLRTRADLQSLATCIAAAPARSPLFASKAS